MIIPALKPTTAVHAIRRPIFGDTIIPEMHTIPVGDTMTSGFTTTRCRGGSSPTGFMTGETDPNLYRFTSGLSGPMESKEARREFEEHLSNRPARAGPAILALK